jgi:hypothetical protein
VQYLTYYRSMFNSVTAPICAMHHQSTLIARQGLHSTPALHVYHSVRVTDDGAQAPALPRTLNSNRSKKQCHVLDTDSEDECQPVHWLARLDVCPACNASAASAPGDNTPPSDSDGDKGDDEPPARRGRDKAGNHRPHVRAVLKYACALMRNEISTKYPQQPPQVPGRLGLLG